jgi:hypothetical protein
MPGLSAILPPELRINHKMLHAAWPTGAEVTAFSDIYQCVRPQLKLLQGAFVHHARMQEGELTGRTGLGKASTEVNDV